jgi:hypothetical protein
MMQIEEAVLAIRAAQCLGARCLEQEGVPGFTSAARFEVHQEWSGSNSLHFVRFRVTGIISYISIFFAS